MLGLNTHSDVQLIRPSLEKQSHRGSRAQVLTWLTERQFRQMGGEGVFDRGSPKVCIDGQELDLGTG